MTAMTNRMQEHPPWGSRFKSCNPDLMDKIQMWGTMAGLSLLQVSVMGQCLKSNMQAKAVPKKTNLSDVL